MRMKNVKRNFLKKLCLLSLSLISDDRRGHNEKYSRTAHTVTGKSNVFRERVLRNVAEEATKSQFIYLKFNLP